MKKFNGCYEQSVAFRCLLFGRTAAVMVLVHCFLCNICCLSKESSVQAPLPIADDTNIVKDDANMPLRRMETPNCSNSVPVVGILTQPMLPTKHVNSSTGDDHDKNSEPEYYYIAASYVKWLEMNGARSIPIPYDASDDLVDEIYSQIDGLLFPGGQGTRLPAAARRLWKLAMEEEQNDGIIFPIWGTCLGFEYLLMLAANGGKSILQHGFDAENVSLPLMFGDESPQHFSKMQTDLQNGDAHTKREVRTKRHSNYAQHNNEYDSKLFPIASSIRQIASENNVTMNNHISGIEPSTFLYDAGLTSIFRITTTNVDRKGRPFVSTIEPQHPDRHSIYGVQYHPEKNTFEYATYPGTNIPYEMIDHSPEGIVFSFSLSSFFVEEVKRCRRKNENVDRLRHSYNLWNRHPLVYSYESILGLSFEQVYVIPSADAWDNVSS